MLESGLVGRVSWKETLPSEERCERPRIKHSTQRCDLSALDVVPFRDKSSSGGGVRHHVVEHAHIITIGKHPLDVDALDNGGQSLTGLEVLVGCGKRVEWTLESHVVLHVRAGGGEISCTERGPVALNNFSCTGGSHVS